jgi:hypothetical protein
MAEDHIFYRRFNYQSIPMDEYEVRDVAQRVDSPDLKLQYFLVNRKATLEFRTDEEWSNPIELNLTIQNESPAPALYRVEHLYIDKRIKVTNSGGFTRGQETVLKIGEMDSEVNSFSQNSGVPGKMPIWQGVSFLICSSQFNIALPKASATEDFVLGWSIDSPGMQQRFGVAFLEVRDSLISLKSQ